MNGLPLGAMQKHHQKFRVSTFYPGFSDIQKGFFDTFYDVDTPPLIVEYVRKAVQNLGFTAKNISPMHGQSLKHWYLHGQ